MRVSQLRILVFTAVLGFGCAQLAVVAPVACKVVSVLNDACMLLTFTAADGTPHTVSCSKEELQEWGQAVESRHALGAQWHPSPAASSVAAPPPW
jgi:hypothetical protein